MVAQPDKVFATENQSRVLVSFRMAMNRRYVDGEGKWKDGETCFIDVQCWNRLGMNVAHTVCKGTPVIVVGRLVQSNWEVEENGKTSKRSIIRVKATHVGVDLNTRFGSFEKSPELVGQLNKPEMEGAVEDSEDEPAMEPAAAHAGVGVGSGVGTGVGTGVAARAGGVVGTGVGTAGGSASSADSSSRAESLQDGDAFDDQEDLVGAASPPF